MNLLDQISGGKTNKPHRILLYGTAGIGKSTFGSMAPSPIFVPTEDRQGHLDCDAFFKRRVPARCTSLEEFMACIGTLYNEPHKYDTVVVDTLDWLEQLVWADVCRARKVTSINDIEFEKGQKAALLQWSEVLAGLDALLVERGMTVILLAHPDIIKFKNPHTDTYDLYTPKLHKLASAMIREWCDEVLFATYKVYTSTSDEGFGKKRAKGVGDGERVVKTTERPAHIAKNSLNLPDEIPFDWNVFAKYLFAESTAA